MNEISFGSTYRIPITQQGVNKAKKLRLKALIGSYPNGLVGNGNMGYARISIPNENDNAFMRKLKGIGYRVYQKFEAENISKEHLDEYIKTCLVKGDYSQVGKQKAALSDKKVKTSFYDYSNSSKNVKETESKVLSASENVVQKKDLKQTKKQAEVISKNQEDAEFLFTNREVADVEKQNRIRQTKSYKDIVERFGEEAAEAIFFYSRKKN